MEPGDLLNRLYPGFNRVKLFVMEQVRLGRTGLSVSAMGLGCGGLSRLGQAQGADEPASIAIVRKAFDLGINLFDTAELYATEEILGKALEGIPRKSVVISTKKTAHDGKAAVEPEMLRAGVEAALTRLRTGYIDIFHLHAVLPDQYPHARENLVPVLLKLREEGKIRFLGITEAFGTDRGHAMLEKALPDGCWDAVMVGFNILNQSARRRVLPAAREKGVGTLTMFAVRKALGNPENFRAAFQELVVSGLVDPGLLDADNPAGKLLAESGAASLPEMAYRFCRYEPGLDVVLSGTGNPSHLEENFRSLSSPPLPEKTVELLRTIFQKVDSVSGG
jgi:aryl-alcohol dehydrogenase-like predicted oxidoreductase